jgi:hypothetical protein
LKAEKHTQKKMDRAKKHIIWYARARKHTRKERERERARKHTRKEREREG